MAWTKAPRSSSRVSTMLNPNERIITGTARINGVDGFIYQVEVTDNGEPGRGVDEFSISLSNGCAAGTEYGEGPIAGGNIQLHKRNPSNTPPGLEALAFLRRQRVVCRPELPRTAFMLPISPWQASSLCA